MNTHAASAACLKVPSILREVGCTTLATLEEAIIQCGVFLSDETPESIRSRGIQGVDSYQMPNQLAPFLLHLNRYPIKSYLEVGVFRGGTFYIVDSYLRLTQPEYHGGVALDSEAKMEGLESYQEAYPSTRFVHMKSRNYEPSYVDLVFIDGAHRYRQVDRDYRHFKPWTKLLAFHDVVSTSHHCPGTKRHWRAIRSNYVSVEFIDQYPGADSVMGIGLLDLERPLSVEGQRPNETSFYI